MCHHLTRRHFVNFLPTCLFHRSSVINSIEGPRLVSDVNDSGLRHASGQAGQPTLPEDQIAACFCF